MSESESGTGNGGPGGRLPRTERYEAPLYLARYLERQARQRPGGDDDGPPADENVPLYLRRFRERRAAPLALDSLPSEPQGFNAKYAEVARSKEIVAPLEARIPVRVSVRLVRHGETQGYSTDSGLTPLGGWQSHRRGFDISKGVREGDKVRLVCADTARARQTADHIHRGLLDGLEQWGRQAEITGPEALPELANFQVATPSGLRDVTTAFREYQSVMEGYERVALGDRPLWLVEVDRFWRTQVAGADPIHYWLTIPMLHFEPPVSCVRRFWSAITRLAEEAPGPPAVEAGPGPPAVEAGRGTVIVAATHSGPIRAFATWAHGYDPGEPYNLEEVVVSVKEGAKEALVAYRNRVTEVHVPPMHELPKWGEAEVDALRGALR
ncbi:MAG: histidine phosphatase family protein [Actinomycetota bacterium]|nr:histidine phosphatase family protein [Actinomycetota bacterium]